MKQIFLSCLIAVVALSVSFFVLLAVPANAKPNIIPNLADITVTTTIQAAIDAANPGDRVLIPSSVYSECLYLTDKSVSLIGEDADTTIVVPTNDAGCYHGLSISGPSITNTTLISGLTFSGGTSAALGGGLSCPSFCGGGILVRGNATPLIHSVVLSGNSGYGGGGLYADNGSPLTLINVKVISNQTTIFVGDGGGGIYAGDSITITGGVFENNKGFNGSGGGLYVNKNFTISGTKFINNFSTRKGGAIYHDNFAGDGLIVNTLFARNSGSLGGGPRGAALYLNSPGVVNLVHTTIADINLNPNDAIAVVSGTVNITNSVITSHTYGISQTGGIVTEDYNLYFGNVFTQSGTIVSGDHSLDGNPNFVNPASNDYDLDYGSAAINKGINADISIDIDNELRDILPDIGAYEFTYSSTPISPTGGTVTPSPDTTIDIPSGVFSDTVFINYITLTHSITSTGALSDVGVFYELNANYLSDGSSAQPQPGTRYTITVTYQQENVPDGFDETNLALYNWDGSIWIKEPTSIVDTVANTITATPNHFSLWAVLGSSSSDTSQGEVYLPIILKF